jgi:hypothetical protein
MVTRTLGARLLVPADRVPSRERLLVTEPFFLRTLDQEPPDAPPRILSFESDSFMTDFLAVAAGKRPALPRLLPWRDWSEPPAGLVDARGQARYATASVARRIPAGADIEASSGPAMDADGIPHGLVAAEKAATPPWLRKLYLPLHERFNLISFDLVCAAAGWPRVERKRIKACGAVIRRFLPGTASSPERWEDWIAVDERHGAWLPLLPADLHTGTPVNPANLPAPTAPLELRLRSLLNLDAGDPLPPLGLVSAPLALLPPDAGPAAQHCTVYGYLPVFSAAREVPSQPQHAGDTPNAVAAALSQQTLARLDSLFQGAADLRDASLPHLRSLLDATVLPTRPSAAAATTANTFVGGLSATAPAGIGQVGNTLARSIDLALLEALARLWQITTAPATDDADIAGNVRNGEALWAASNAAGAATAPGLFDTLPDPNPVTPANETVAWLTGGANSSAWDTLLRLRLHQLMDAWLAGSALPPPAQGNAGLFNTGHAATVVVMALLRLRGCRLTLAARLNRALYNDSMAADLKAVAADGKRQMGLAALAELAETLLAQEAARGDIQATPPWPPVPLPAQWILDVHGHGEAIAKIYARFDDGLAGAGNAAVDQLNARIEAVEAALNTAVAGLRPGLSLGAAQLAFNEQPPCGLLVLPGIRVDGSVLAGFRTAAAARYTAEPERLALPEARSGNAAPRLRFDAEHLYAAWGWARVAGHTPCEPERIVWTRRSEPFSIADPTDLLGARPASIQMPDIPKLLRDIPRIARARAKPFAGMAAPPGSGVITGADMADTRRDFGIGMICNFGIPVLTICALILFKIIFTVLITLPSFSWMLFLKFCLPFPKRGP